MPDMNNINFIGFAASEAGVLITALMLILIMALVGGMFWYYKKGVISRYIGKYAVKVIIFEKRGSTLVPTAIDAGRAIIEKNGKTTYQLKHRGDVLQAPEFDALTANNWLFLFSPTRGEYHPMLISPISGKMIKEIPVYELDKDGEIKLDDKGAPVLKTDEQGNVIIEKQSVNIPVVELQPILTESMKYVFANTVESNYQRFYKPDVFEKFMPLLIILALCIGIMLILWVTLGQMEPLFNMGSAVASQCGSIISSLPPAPAAPPA